jgi:hypothetical protein
MGNPMTGEAYLLLDQPRNPPPPMELGFKPNRAYVPSVPSPFAMVQERLPALLDTADVTLATLKDIMVRMPATLDRTDRFMTSAERMMRESELPALSADSRRFFATTSAQISQMSSDLNSVMGSQGTVVKLSDETRSAIKAADLPATSQAAREAADSSRLAAEDLRRSLPAIRTSLDRIRELTRQLEEQPESVIYGTRKEQGKNK